MNTRAPARNDSQQETYQASTSQVGLTPVWWRCYVSVLLSTKVVDCRSRVHGSSSSLQCKKKSKQNIQLWTKLCSVLWEKGWKSTRKKTQFFQNATTMGLAPKLPLHERHLWTCAEISLISHSACSSLCYIPLCSGGSLAFLSRFMELLEGCKGMVKEEKLWGWMQFRIQLMFSNETFTPTYSLKKPMEAM